MGSRIILKCILPFLLISRFVSEAYSQDDFKFDIGAQSVGIIYLNDSIPIGTGFVLLDSHVVITCAHVARRKGKKTFRPARSNLLYLFEQEVHNNKGDITIFRSIDPIPSKPLKMDTTFAFENNASIIYIGFDKELSSEKGLIMAAHHSKIEANGRIDKGNIGTEYFEFVGEGRPGYSGSPVFNSDGKVIGILAQAWYRTSLKNQDSRELINRAFSLKEIYKIFKASNHKF